MPSHRLVHPEVVKRLAVTIKRPEDLLTPEQRKRLDKDLIEMARQRRRALAAAAHIYLA